MIQRPQLPSDRRFLIAGAGVGGVLLGLAVLRMSSGGNEAAVGPVSTTTRPPQTPTLTQPAPTSEAAPALIAVPDPFAQLVAVPQAQAAQSGAVAAVAGQPAQAAQPVQPAQASTTRTARAAATTTTATATTSTTATTTTLVQAVAPRAVPTTTPTIAPDAVSASAGPTALPGVSVNVCVGEAPSTCFPTPPATSVALTVAATVTPGAARRPTVTPGACPNGQGVALVVDPGSAGADVAMVLAMIIGGQPSSYLFVSRGVAPDRALTVSACVPPGPGGPSSPGATGPGLTSLIGGVLQPVLTGLGVTAPAGP